MQESHPSFQGVVPPLLRIQACSKKAKILNIPLDVNGFYEDLLGFIERFGHKGEYHNHEHFVDVAQRFKTDLEFLKKKYPSEFDDLDFLKAEMASRSHDAVHNAYGKHDPAFTLSANQICALYGFAPNNSHMLGQIVEAINFGIEEDNRLNGGTRPTISKKKTNGDEPITLSEEEMSQIVQDAYAYRNGFSFDLRCEISGMLQATEFKRSMIEGQPAFKWPRTQMELLMKLSDIGNFCDPTDHWIATSTRVNTELPFFKGISAIGFINEELFFINTYVKPVLDPKNQPTIEDVSGDRIPARVPDYYLTSIVEKENFLLRLRSEIESITEAKDAGIEIDESNELKQFKEAIRPALAKTDNRLNDPKVEVPLVAGESPELQTHPAELPVMGLARKILGR